jgi:hypothetical protein
MNFKEQMYMVVAQFDVLSQHIHGATGENHGKLSINGFWGWHLNP